MKKLLVVILVALGTLGFGIGVRPAMAAKPYIEMGSINNTTVITNRLVIFEMRGGNYKKMDISRGCSGIRNGFFFQVKARPYIQKRHASRRSWGAVLYQNNSGPRRGIIPQTAWGLEHSNDWVFKVCYR